MDCWTPEPRNHELQDDRKLTPRAAVTVRFPYLILGDGMILDAAVRGIRELDVNRSIGLLGAEVAPAYARPPFSRTLWQGEPVDSVWRKTDGVSFVPHPGRRAARLDLGAKKVFDDHGVAYFYDKLLLATSGLPRRLPFGGEQVLYLRTFDDYRRLRALASQGKSFAVIGGGFVGSGIAAALAQRGCKVTLLFPEAGIGARLFPADLGRFLVGYYRERGVDVRCGEEVAAVARSGSGIAVTTQSGMRSVVDVVVSGLGTVPNVRLAAAAGLAAEGCVWVDERLRTTHPDVFAAGDAARFSAPVPSLEDDAEPEASAFAMGRAAGRSMAGDPTSYAHLPSSCSDLFDLRFAAVGAMDPRAETVADWKVPFREGVVYYLSGGRVCGVLLWNTSSQMVGAARALIAQPGPFCAADLAGRLSC